MPRERTRDKFVELAEKRTVRSIKSIRLVGNLSNRSNYKYTEEDASKIIRTLEVELKELRRKFSGGGTSTDIDFKL